MNQANKSKRDTLEIPSLGVENNSSNTTVKTIVYAGIADGNGAGYHDNFDSISLHSDNDQEDVFDDIEAIMAYKNKNLPITCTGMVVPKSKQRINSKLHTIPKTPITPNTPITPMMASNMAPRVAPARGHGGGNIHIHGNPSGNSSGMAAIAGAVGVAGASINAVAGGSIGSLSSVRCLASVTTAKSVSGVQLGYAATATPNCTPKIPVTKFASASGHGMEVETVVNSDIENGMLPNEIPRPWLTTRNKDKRNSMSTRNRELLKALPQITAKFDELFPFYRLSDKDCKQLSLLVYDDLNEIMKIFCNARHRTIQVKIYYNNFYKPRIITYFNKEDSEEQVSAWDDITMNEEYCLQRIKKLKKRPLTV